MAPKRRRASGEGAVFKRGSDGLWVGTIDLGVVDGRRRRKAVYGQSEREVLTKLSTLRAAHDRGIDLLAPSLTIGQWLDVWLSEIKGFDGTRPRTLTLYKGLAERYVKPVIGGVRLDKLTPAHVQRLVTETRNTRTSCGTPPAQRLHPAARVQASSQCPGRCLPHGASDQERRNTGEGAPAQQPASCGPGSRGG